MPYSLSLSLLYRYRLVVIVAVMCAIIAVTFISKSGLFLPPEFVNTVIDLLCQVTPCCVYFILLR